ncbi:hypothetical protein FRC07_000438 [Ceratobasidium sp. 392]|nr:hypothetical protein FRC07_000438 [Ceratobasidium sp. 392]
MVATVIGLAWREGYAVRNPTPTLNPELLFSGPPSTAVCIGICCVDRTPLESVTTTNDACAVGINVPFDRVMSGVYVLAPSPVDSNWPGVGTKYVNVGVDEVDLDERGNEDVDEEDEAKETDVGEGDGENKYGGVVYVGVGRTKFGSVVANVADSADRVYDTASGVSFTALVDKGYSPILGGSFPFIP